MNSREAVNLRDFGAAGLSFLRAELRVTSMLLNLAETGGRAQRIRRRHEARRGYDTMMRFRDRVNLTNEQSNEIDVGIATVRSRLQQLGDDH